MNSSAVAASCSEDDNGNEDFTAGRAADLLTAASEGRGQEVVRILEVDPDLLRVGDPVGDTTLHVLARAGHVDALQQLIGFLQEQHQELLSMVAIQENGHGETPLHLAVKNKHKVAVLLLYKVAPMARWMKSEDGKSPHKLAKEAGENNLFVCEDDRSRGRSRSRSGWRSYFCGGCFKQEQEQEQKQEEDEEQEQLGDEGSTPAACKGEDGVCSNQDEDNLASRYTQCLKIMYQNNSPERCKSAMADLEMELVRTNYVMIIEKLENDLSLIQHKNRIGNNILHEAASSGNMDLLTKLIGELLTPRRLIIFDDDQLQLTKSTLLLERNYNGDTPLHLALSRRHVKAARYLMEVAPEAAYQVNNKGESPLYMAIKHGHHDLVKYLFQLMPLSPISPATRLALLHANKGSLPHAAIRARNLTILEVILENLPSLIDSSDEKGWKPLSYAAYKGYLEDVRYLLKNFPESAKKFDGDGCLPIHKAVSGGHISIFQEFISFHPQTLYDIDKKGRSILHIAAKYAKADFLIYLTRQTHGVEKIFDLRDHDGKTFADLVKEMKRN